MPGKSEKINDRIDLNRNNDIDINEITSFIFNENDGEKNLNDLGEYLNGLEFGNNDVILAGIKRYFDYSKEWAEMSDNIQKKVNANEPLSKKELCLTYLDMISSNFEQWQGLYGFNLKRLYGDEIKFDANKPIGQICGGKLILFIQQKYKFLMYTGGERPLKTPSETLQGMRLATKEEIQEMPRDLIKSGWTYFIKGRQMIAKAVSGIIGSIGEFVGGIFRRFIDFKIIKSSPSEKNPRTGVTQCSTTARKNANFFGISLPNGDAKQGVHNPIIDKKHFINIKTKSGNNNKCIDINIASPDTANFADISVESDTTNGRKYGHRATAFKNNDGQRYVLDPYYSGGYDTKPIPRNKYPKHTRAEQINFYNAPKQSRSVA